MEALKKKIASLKAFDGELCVEHPLDGCNDLPTADWVPLFSRRLTTGHTLPFAAALPGPRKAIICVSFPDIKPWRLESDMLLATQNEERLKGQETVDIYHAINHLKAAMPSSVMQVERLVHLLCCISALYASASHLL